MYNMETRLYPRRVIEGMLALGSVGFSFLLVCFNSPLARFSRYSQLWLFVITIRTTY